MPDPRSPSVAVVGAAGFVGRALLNELQRRGIKVTAVVRGAPELSVDSDFHRACSHADALTDGAFDIVVNLAYPAGGPSYEHHRLNLEIGDTVSGLLKDGGRLIQVSTLAVFGMALERPISAGPVSEARDISYVESKIVAERMFTVDARARGLSLDIVRLGNVWGYASGSWVLPLVHRLLTGRPVGIVGAAGYSNSTDVANVASYLAFLIENNDCLGGAHYHHLAEFSSVRWDEWIAPLVDVLGVEPQYAERSALRRPASGLQEMGEAFTSLRVRNIYRQLSQERVTGSWTRMLVRQLPRTAQLRLKREDLVSAADPHYSRADQTFLAVVAGEREFRSIVDPGWEPPLTREQSLEGVLRWLGRN